LLVTDDDGILTSQGIPYLNVRPLAVERNPVRRGTADNGQAVAIPLQIEDRDGVIVVYDRPGCLWLFGAWFVAGGVLAAYIAFFGSNAGELAAWERALAVLIALGCAAGGIFFIAQAPSTRAMLDPRRNEVVVVTRGLRGTSELRFAFDQIKGVELGTTRDSEGGPMYRVELRLRDGRLVPLQGQHAHGREQLDERASALRRSLGLTTTTAA
jgi:hypothetical protein